MKSPNLSFPNITRYIVDIVCILFVLSVGIAVYSSSWRKLYWALTIPYPPVISDEDWPGSTIKSLERQASYGGYQYSVLLSRPYSHEGLETFISVNNITNWYRNPQDVIGNWNSPEAIFDKSRYDTYSFYQFEYSDRDFLAGFYDISLPADLAIPSTLKCRDWDESRRTCVYFGYHEHWFTQIWFMSEDKSVLTEELMNELIEKAVKIILETPTPTQ